MSEPQRARPMGHFTDAAPAARRSRRGDRPAALAFDLAALRAKLTCAICGAQPPKFHPAGSACPGAQPEHYIGKLLGDLTA